MKVPIIYFSLIFMGALLASCESTSTEARKVASDITVDSNTQHDAVNQSLNEESYEILAIDHNSAVQNFHVLLKTGKYDKPSLQDFVNRFRNEKCTMQCNISIYDDKSIKSLVTKYPLADKEYLIIADHFVAASTFDMNEVWLYPYQDIKYKELGGKNWKKEKI